MQDENTPLFRFYPAKSSVKPILVSIPHAGTYFPMSEQSYFRTEVLNHPEDTDWFVDQLYSFAPDLGISIICANYSRYVIDLNRSPNDQKLYDPNRKETGLLPSHSFSGKPLYKDERLPDSTVRSRRLEHYYWPYYSAIRAHLEELQTSFSRVLLFEAHSIKRCVPMIQKQPFSDIILGNQDHKCCPPTLIDAAKKQLEAEDFNVSINAPFKGGHLTRYFGQRESGIYSLQLEMSQDLYMDERETKPVEILMHNTQQALHKLLITLDKELNH